MDIQTDKSYKYDYEKLDPASEEFNFLNETFMSTFLFKGNTGTEVAHIYKVNERNNVKTAVKPVSNLMLYHGTSEKGATGILKEGFRYSEKGWFGKGVYMTDCLCTALNYSKQLNVRAHNFYTFVNEVLESETLQTFTFDYNVIYKRGDVTTLPKNQFEKYFLKSSPQPTKEDYIVDVEGRRYINTSKRSPSDEYIAEASITIPRYLIVLKRKQNRQI